MNKNNVLISLKDIIEDLNPAFKRIALYVIENHTEIQYITIIKLSENCQVSVGTITSFIQSLGFKNFQHFKIYFAQHPGTEGSENNDKLPLFNIIEEDDSTEKSIEKLQNIYISTIQNTMKNINISDMDKAIKAIQECDCLTIFCVGNSSVAGNNALMRFTRLKKNVHVCSDPAVMGRFAAMMGENDVAIGMCYSGKTEIIKKSLEYSKKNGAFVITITGPNASIQLIKDRDVNFTYYNIEDDVNDIFQTSASSRLSQIALMDVMFAGVAKYDYEKSHEKIKNTAFAAADILKNKKL